MTTLKALEHAFSKDGFDCALMESPEPFLQLFLGSDQDNKEKILTIAIADSLYQETTPICHLQFKVVLSAKAKDNTQDDLGSLLHFLNLSLELPGFELNEADGSVTYRYTYIVEKEGASLTVLKAIVGAIGLTIDLFGGVIKQVASGALTYDEIIEAILAQDDTL